MIIDLVALGFFGVVVFGTAPVWKLAALKWVQGWNKPGVLSRAVERQEELDELWHRSQVALATAAATLAEANAKVLHNRATAHLESGADEMLQLPGYVQPQSSAPEYVPPFQRTPSTNLTGLAGAYHHQMPWEDSR
jgi:hypothetical protein